MKTRTILLEVFFFSTLFLLVYLHLGDKVYFNMTGPEVEYQFEGWRSDVLEHQLYLEEVAMKGDIWIRNKPLIIPTYSSIK